MSTEKVRTEPIVNTHNELVQVFSNQARQDKASNVILDSLFGKTQNRFMRMNESVDSYDINIFEREMFGVSLNRSLPVEEVGGNTDHIDPGILQYSQENSNTSPIKNDIHIEPKWGDRDANDKVQSEGEDEIEEGWTSVEYKKKVRNKKKENLNNNKENQLRIKSTRSNKTRDVGYTHISLGRPSN